LSRHLRLKRNAQSLAISVCFHAALLSLLCWIVISSVADQKLVLTASSSAQRDHEPFVLLPPPSQIDVDADPDEPQQIDMLNSAKLFASVNAHDMLSLPDANQDAIKFFGSQAYGNRFVFILDISLSMDARNGDRFKRAKAELIRSVSGLSPQQSYYVLLFSWQTVYMYDYQSRYAYSNKQQIAANDPRLEANDPQLEYVPATAENLQRLRYWLANVRLLSGTDPRRALSLAHSLQPDAIFFLSDGRFNRPAKGRSEGWINKQEIPSHATVAEGVKIALSDVPVHTIAYENPLTRAVMKEIAGITGGSSRYVKTQSLQPLVPASLINGLRTLRKLRAQSPQNLEAQHAARLKYAELLIEDGELAFAEYLLRPARGFDFKSLPRHRLAEEFFGILDAELGDVRVADFGNVSLVEIERDAQTNKRFPRFRGL
jgi:hypothetical protein